MKQVKWFLMAAALLVSGHGQAGAAEASDECRKLFRQRKLSLVVPHAAGGGFDGYARALAPVLEQASGARVVISNMPNRLSGMRAVAEAGEEALRIGLFEAASLVQAGELHEELRLDRFAALGTVAVEVQTWVGRPDFSLAAYGKQQPLVSAVSDPSASVVEVGITAHLLGIPFRFTAGYGGSPDRFSAVLRKEVDIVSNSVTSSIKASIGGDLKPVLVLAEGPLQELPGVPYLAGRGGLVDQQTRGQAAPARDQAMRLASMVAEQSRTYRSLFVSRKIRATTQRCLAGFVEEALFSDQFARASLSVGRPVAPRNAVDTQALLARIEAASREHRELIRRLLLEASR